MYVNRDAPNQCEDFVDTQSPDTVDAARRTVANYALDSEDARELMMALGIHPSQKGDNNPRVGSAGDLNRISA